MSASPFSTSSRRIAAAVSNSLSPKRSTRCPITILKDASTNDLNSGIVCIHAALVPTATGAAIVYFGTNDEAWLFDVDAPQQPPVQLATKPGWWAFCSAHAFLNDGRWVIAGEW